MELTPIGMIRTPHKTREGMPIQPPGAAGVRGTIDIKPEYRPGLRDLDGFSHIILIYHFHQSEGYKLEVVPFMDTQSRGVFSTRAPRRPNPVGLSTVRLLSVKDGVLEIEGVDVLDGTPLLDIKPYVPDFDPPEVERTGWLEQARKTVAERESDERFK